MGDNDTPLVSIIVPSYNQGRFIRETIESCMAQDYRPIEVIVVDGASSDETIEILHSYDQVPEIKWISEPDSGVAEAVNKGFAMAKGKIAGIQSSDDAYMPNAFSQAVQQFKEFPKLGIVYGDWIYINGDGVVLKRYKTGPYSLENFLCMTTIIPQHAAFFRLNLALEVGGWNSDYFIADTEMWLRILFRANAKKVDAFWGIRRLHEEQRNKQTDKIISSFRQMVEKSTDLAKAPGNIKRAANCGKFIIAANYNSENSRIREFYYYIRAILVFPTVYRSHKLARIIIPGYWVLYHFFSKIRHTMATVRNNIFRD